LARADILPALDTVALLKHESGLIKVAAPFLNALSRAAGDERHAAMLSDGSGRVLKIVADPLTLNDPNFPQAGSLLSEAVAGANGIGTALAEGHYVELVGPEHYIEGFHIFTCQGVTLAGALGRPAGVLSMSLRRAEAASKVRDVLFCASEAAECELLAVELHGQGGNL
jgi:transcriptional regulator of acetoin/glycerol metabolism